MKQKIAFVATVYRHLEAFHIPVMALLQQKGYEIHAYAHPDGGKPFLEKQNIICHDIPFSRSPFHFQNLMALKQVVESFQQERFRMIHVHTPVGSILGRLAARVTKVPCVIYTAHGFHFFEGAPIHYWLLFYPIERFMARWTDFLITINQEDFKIAQTFPVKKEILYVPGVGINCHVFDNHSIDSQQSDQLKKITILCVAELNSNKNQIQLLRALHILQRYNSFICFLAGSGPKEKELRELTNQLGLLSDVRFLGYRNDIPQLLNDADIVVLLSKREGLPKSLMEAMAAGKPIVATNVRGNRDLVHHGENGYLVPVHDVQATVQALHTLMQDASLRKRMGEKSRELSRSYDLSLILKQMEEIYDRALHE